MKPRLTRRAGPLFGAWLVVAALLATFAPVVPTVTATDPTPTPPAASPSVSPAVTPAPTDTPSPAPQPSASAVPPASASPSPGASGSAAPSPSPSASAPASPTPAPQPSGSLDPSPSLVPSASPDPSGSPQPSPSASDEAPPSGSPEPSPIADEIPSASPEPSVNSLIGLAVNVDPTSPHVISGLVSDTCAACHTAHHAPDGRLLPTTYRDDPLRSTGEAYVATEFGLCFSCHSGPQQAAIEDTSGTLTGTNFPGHGFHLRSIDGYSAVGAGTDITTPGDGQGNALCAECHDNLHGTTGDTRGLVKFAPDVVAYGGLPISYDATTGTCTLTCHGVGHDGAIVPAP